MATNNGNGFQITKKRAEIVKAMRALQAVGAKRARNSDDIASKAGLVSQDVKHYCYKDGELVQLGYVGICRPQEMPEEYRDGKLGYYLTAKGVKAKIEA